MPTRKLLLWASGVLLTLVISLGTARRLYTAPEGPVVRFEPEVYEFGKSPVFSGDRVRFDAALVNVSAMPVRITAIPRTCGCLTFVKDAELPMTLPPGGRLPLGVEMGTEGKTGEQVMQIYAEGTTGQDRPIATPTLTIHGHIWSSILALPDEIYAEVREDERSRPLVRTVELADEWSGNGMEISKITSTAGDRMKFELTPAQGRMIVRGLDVSRRSVMTIRYQISPDAKAFDETITITSRPDVAQPPTIRLRGRIIPEFEFQPASLVFYGSGLEAPQSRLLVYRYSRDEYKTIRPAEMPDRLKLEELPGSEGAKRFRVTCTPWTGSGKEVVDLSFAVGDDGRTVKVPVTISGP